MYKLFAGKDKRFIALNRGLMRFVFLSLIVVGALVYCLSANKTNAFWATTPPVQPGFPQTLSGASLWDSPMTLADLDGNPDTLEIVFGGRNRNGGSLLNTGKVYAYRPNGQLYWETTVRAPVQGSVAVADIDNDGVVEVLVPLGGYVGINNVNGGLIALNGRTGAEEWTFTTEDWLNHSPNGYADGVYASPAVGDIDADGDLEIVFGAWDQCIYALDHQGQPVWPELNGIPNQTHCGGHGFYNEDTIWSSPALADLDNNGDLEIIIGADITSGNQHGDPSGGYMYVIDHDGTELAREWLNQRMYSSPAITDLEGDGTLEIIVGSGTHLNGTGYWVKVFNYQGWKTSVVDRLATKYTLSTDGRVFSSPAVADLNGDGYQDIVAISNIGNGPETGGADLGSKVYGWNGRNGQRLFATPICDSFNNSWATHTSPVIAEVGRAGDNGLKILFSHSWEVGILNANGSYYTDPGASCTSATNYCTGFSHTTNITYWTNFTTIGTPAVGDIDGDGKVEVVVAGGVGPANPNVGALYVWEPGRTVGDLPWPQFRYNAYNTGVAIAPELEVTTTQLDIPFQETEASGGKSFAVRNGVPGSVLKWEATVDFGDQAAWFTLSKASGETVVIDTINLDIDENITQEKGVYTATIHVECVEGCGVQSSATIDVTFEVPPERLTLAMDSAVLWVSTSGSLIQSTGLPVVNDGAAGRVDWTASSSQSWLTATPNCGNTDDNPVVTITADRSTLSPGVHYATVTFSVTEPVNVEDPVQTLNVEVRVGDFSFVYMPMSLR